MPNTLKRKCKKRHIRLWAQLPFTLCRKIGVTLDKEQHVTKLVETSKESEVTIVCSQQVITLTSFPKK